MKKLIARLWETYICAEDPDDKAERLRLERLRMLRTGVQFRHACQTWAQSQEKALSEFERAALNRALLNLVLERRRSSAR